MRRLAAKGKLAVLVDAWGRRVRKIGRLETRAEACRRAVRGASVPASSVVAKLSRLLEQIAVYRAREADVISRIIHIEDRHRFMRERGGLRRAAAVAYSLNPLEEGGGLFAEDEKERLRREKREDERRRRRARSWLWAFLAFMMFSETSRPAYVVSRSARLG